MCERLIEGEKMEERGRSGQRPIKVKAIMKERRMLIRKLSEMDGIRKRATEW